MARLSFLISTLLTVFLSLKLLKTLRVFQLVYKTRRHDQRETRDDDFFYSLLDRKRRIDLVRRFLSDQGSDFLPDQGSEFLPDQGKEFLPRENVAVFGVPGALSEIVSDVIGGEPGVFYLPNILQSLAYYIQHDPTIAIPLTTEMFDNVFKCELRDKPLMMQLMQNRTLVENIHPCVVVKTTRYNSTLVSNACIKAFSDWLTAKCRHSDLTVAQTDKLKSISYLEVFASEVKARRIRFKVVHVVRDPRAIVYELTKKRKLNYEHVRRVASRICTRVRMNLETARSSQIWRPGLYNLVKIEQFVRDFEVSGRHNHVSVSMNVWKSKMSLKVRRLIETECVKVIKMLGYTK